MTAVLSAELAALAQERAAIEAEQSELASAAAALEAQLDDLGNAEPAGILARLRDAVRQAEARREQWAGRDRAAKEAHDEAQRALIAARECLAQAAPSWSAGGKPSASWPYGRVNRSCERVQLEARRARLADQRVELDRDEAADAA